MFQSLLQVPLSVQDSNDLKRDSLRPIDDDVLGEFRNGPKANWQVTYVLPFGSHERMLGQPATGGDNFHFPPGLRLPCCPRR